MPGSRILIAAPKSGSGKTLITCGIMKALKDKGLSVHGMKCGPDFIDPMFHEKVLGVPSRNLDGFLMEPRQMRQAVRQHGTGADITVIEGVMGYYDGIGAVSDACSTYETAAITRTPVILVVDARGSGLSVVPLIRGIAQYRAGEPKNAGDGQMAVLSEKTDSYGRLFARTSGIAGVILNQVPDSLSERLAEMILRETGIPVLGNLAPNPVFSIGSRHLGLILPDELADLKERLDALACAVKARFDLDRILGIAKTAGAAEVTEPSVFAGSSGVSEFAGFPENTDISLEKRAPSQSEQRTGDSCRHVRIAVAKDEAFCFLYQDNLKILRDLGAEIVFFSPLKDAALPEGTAGLLLPGGYPELFAEELSANVTMRRAVREAAASGMPVMAECGGFLYMHRAIRDREGTSFPMAGVLQEEAYYAGKTGRFGYITVIDSETGVRIRAHEYHAWESTAPGSDCLAVKPGPVGSGANPDSGATSASGGHPVRYDEMGGKRWRCIHKRNGGIWGFPHLYYPSTPWVAETYLRAAVSHGEDFV